MACTIVRAFLLIVTYSLIDYSIWLMCNLSCRMATWKDVSKQISDITECSICTESFKEPKMLPCIHTFCLHCLEKYGKEKVSGDKMDCPVCRSEFTIPSGGFKDLRSNFFMNQLMQVNMLSGNDAKVQNVHCEVCSRVSEVSTAVAFCLECQQHLCEPCNKKHKVQAFSSSHHIVTLIDKPSAKELLRMMPSYCEQHRNEEIKFYCYDCKTTACVVCYVANKHNKHECADVKTCAETFRTELKDDIGKVAMCALQSNEEIKNLETKQKSFISTVDDTKREISQKYDQLRSMIDEHQKQLIATLASFEKKRVKELETRKDELERQSVMMESFKRYCEEVMEKGTACDRALPSTFAMFRSSVDPLASVRTGARRR